MTTKASLSLVGALGAVAVGAVRHALVAAACRAQGLANCFPMVARHGGRWSYDGRAGALYLERTLGYVSATAASHLYLLPLVAVATTPDGSVRVLLRIDREVTDGSLRAAYEAPQPSILLGAILGAFAGAGAAVRAKEDPAQKPTGEGPLLCDGAKGCSAPCVWRCDCRRCGSEPEVSERFHCCDVHPDAAADAHRRVYPSHTVVWTRLRAPN
jgi:hypothetical protein